MFINMQRLTGDAQKDIIALHDQYIALRRELEDMLNNLDDDNIRKITARSIETSTLVVGDNIQMGPNATISWNKVTEIPNDIVYQAALANYVTTGTLSLTLVDYVTNGHLTTTLGENYVVTGLILANQITGGSFTAINEINIGAMVDNTNTKYLRFVNGAYLYNYNYFGEMIGLGISAGEVDISPSVNLLLPNSVESPGGGLSAYGDWNFSNANVEGLDNYALVDHTHSQYVKTMASQNLRMQVIEGAEFNYVEIWLGSTYMGKVDLV